MPSDLCDPRTVTGMRADTPAAKLARRSARAAWRAKHVWHPHQLRHAAATRLRKAFGLEAAQAILGHKTLKVTEIYAEKNVEAARKIMAAVG
jgi:integrase